MLPGVKAYSKITSHFSDDNPGRSPACGIDRHDLVVDSVDDRLGRVVLLSGPHFSCIHRQDDLARFVGFSGQHFMGQTGLSERQYFADIRFKLAGIEQLGNSGQAFGCDGNEKEHALDPVFRGFCLIGPGYRRHEDIAGFENGERPVEGLPPDGIDNDIDARHLLFETCRLHVDDLVGAKGMKISHIAGKRSGDDFGTDPLRQLDRKPADITGGTVHKHTFGAIHLPVIKHHLSCRARHDRNRCSFDVIQASRLACEHRGVCDGVFGIGAGEPGIRHAEYIIPGAEAGHPRPNVFDDT